MTPHDVELKRYNDIVERLDQAYNECIKFMEHRANTVVTNDMRDSIFMAGIYICDAKDKFKVYAESKYDT
jgi:hypothetical protein